MPQPPTPYTYFLLLSFYLLPSSIFDVPGEASHRMMQIEGSWVGGLRPSARVARRETTCEVS